MKKALLTILFGLASIVIFGQVRLGSSVTEIKKEFWESSYKLKGGYTDDNLYYISIETERASVIYYFNSDKVCTLCAILPDNQGQLNYYVELYNNQYVIVSPTQWKMYSNNGIANINLVYPDEGGYVFIWSN